LRVPKASELIAGRLRGQIIRGDLKDGDLLPNEAAMVEQFGVSRPTLREALRILESESLLHITQGSREGARVTSPSERTLAGMVGQYLQFKKVTVLDVHEAVIAIEVPAVMQMAGHSSPSAIARLAAALERESEVAGDWSTEIVAGVEFHRLMIELAGNQTLAIVHQLLEGIILASGREIGRSAEPKADALAKQFRKVHSDTLELIKARNVDAAQDLWRRHLRAKLRYLESIEASRGTVYPLVDVLPSADALQVHRR
jgi:DNA-binding FadR family transcriptional regulator